MSTSRRNQSASKMEDSSDKVHIEKLGTDNYESWKILIELCLTQKGLEACIEEDTRTEAQLAARTAAEIQKEKSSQMPCRKPSSPYHVGRARPKPSSV